MPNAILTNLTKAALYCTLAFGLYATPATAEDFPIEAQTQICAAKWSDDFSMQLFCIKEQAKSYENLPSVLAGLPSDVAGVIRTKYANNWREDYAMQEFCSKDQAEGW